MAESSLRADEQAGLCLRKLYMQHGYQPYRMSKFEPYDLYVRNKSFLISENILTFTDTDGRLMALKPDVTLSIVRNAQPPAGGLEKVYYHENVYRTTSARLGFREIMQTGLECIGDLDLTAMGEVLSLASESLRLLGGGRYLLDLGHMGLVSGMLEKVHEESVKEQLLTELGRKNVPALEHLCAQAGVEQEIAGRLCHLAQLYGPPGQVLPRLEELASGKQAEAALAELEGLCRIVEGLGMLEGLRLDFSIANDMRYYNGIIFRGYLPGLASGVLAGGRYDNLLRRMGKTGQAIGFAVYLDQLELLDGGSEYDVDILLLYGPEAEDPSAQSEWSLRDCAGGNWSGSRKEGRRDGDDQRRPAQRTAGREGLRPLQSRWVPLPFHRGGEPEADL